MTIRYIKQNSRKDTCKNCPELDVNYNSDESYCNLADGEEVRLKRGQHRPEWCPKRDGRINLKATIRDLKQIMKMGYEDYDENS